MLTHFSSFSFPITAHFSLIFEPIRDQVCLLYPFLRSIHFQILMLPEISMPRGIFSPGYLGEPKNLPYFLCVVKCFHGRFALTVV